MFSVGCNNTYNLSSMMQYPGLDTDDQSQDSTADVKELVMDHTEDDMPTVLAEFSSVVADTQQYLDTHVSFTCIYFVN